MRDVFEDRNGTNVVSKDVETFEESVGSDFQIDVYRGDESSVLLAATTGVKGAKPPFT